MIDAKDTQIMMIGLFHIHHQHDYIWLSLSALHILVDPILELLADDPICKTLILMMHTNNINRKLIKDNAWLLVKVSLT